MPFSRFWRLVSWLSSGSGVAAAPPVPPVAPVAVGAADPVGTAESVGTAAAASVEVATAWLGWVAGVEPAACPAPPLGLAQPTTAMPTSSAVAASLVAELT